MSVVGGGSQTYKSLKLARKALDSAFVPGQVATVSRHQVGIHSFDNVKIRPEPNNNFETDDQISMIPVGYVVLVVATLSLDRSERWLLLVSSVGCGWADEIEGLLISK